MPYIEQSSREAAMDNPVDAGELNFAISSMIDRYIQRTGAVNYAKINEVVGVLECAKMEFYRRMVYYEELKMAENGDVYTCLTSANHVIDAVP